MWAGFSGSGGLLVFVLIRTSYWGGLELFSLGRCADWSVVQLGFLAMFCNLCIIGFIVVKTRPSTWASGLRSDCGRFRVSLIGMNAG